MTKQGAAFRLPGEAVASVSSVRTSDPAVLLSFIIPTFNRSRLVLRAISSVLSQLDGRIAAELIVVDDGSTDDTAVTLSSFGQCASVRVVRFDSNRGLGAARNAAIAASRGEWCALLDSDNALYPGALARLVDALRLLPADVGVFWGGSQTFAGAPQLRHNVSGRVEGTVILSQALGGEHFSVIRRELALGNLYPLLGTRHACEPAFWAALAAKTAFFVSGDVFQLYDDTGLDRFCAARQRITRATEMAVCFEHTATVVGSRNPQYYWQLRGKAAVYRCVAGSWRRGVVDAFRLLPGLHRYAQNIAVIAACIAGPAACRQVLLRMRGA